MPDDLWPSAYGEPYDPRPAIEARRVGQVQAPQELWNKLYHQGAVNSASYAAVGDIVRMMQKLAEPDWNAYSLLGSIEEARFAEGNPPIPPELEQDYKRARVAIVPLALRDLLEAQDDLIVRSALAVVAHAKGQHTLAAFALCTEDERAEMLSL